MLALATRLAREAGAIQRERYETVLAHRHEEPADRSRHRGRSRLRGAHRRALRARAPDDAVLAEEGGGTDRAGRRLALGDRPARRHHQLRPRLPALLRLDRRRARGVRKRSASSTTRCSTSSITRVARRRRAAQRPADPRLAASASSAARCSRPASPTTCATSTTTTSRNSARFVKRARAVRRDGSAALDLCYVACGRFDGYWELKLHALGRRGGHADRRGSGRHASPTPWAEAPFAPGSVYWPRTARSTVR